MIADVAFDAPLASPFSYRVPDGWILSPGQRVLAPLKGPPRVGLVVAVRDGAGEGLKPLARIVDPEPLLTPEQLDLARWVAAETLASFGSTCLALLPPPTERGVGGARRGSDTGTPAKKPTRSRELEDASGLPELLTGAGREARLIALLTGDQAPALVLTPDVESAARWAQRLGKAAPVVRLDSGVPDAERTAAWQALARGAAPYAVGTRSALLAPLPPGGRLALIDEQEAAHKPPGHPRLHAREVALERAARQSLRTLLTAGTPSVEMWWRAEHGSARLTAAPKAAWPTVAVADTRGIARREALTPTLARAIRETLAAGRRVFLGVSRLTSALGCDECGAILKCADCAIAMAYSPAARGLECRLCGTTAGLPETCPACRGRRLMPFGWGAERVEHAVRRRFARARIARYDPDIARGRRGEAQRDAALAAEVVIGTRGVLKLFGPASLGLAGFVSPDQMLGIPDFRAAERTFALLWAAAERVRGDGAVIVQSQNPTHHALEALGKQDLSAFYTPEMRFRADAGYPPFRRLALITVATGPATGPTADAVASALAGAPGLTVYPPTPDRRNRVYRIVVKGGPDLPRVLGESLRGLLSDGASRSRGIIEVEVDPVEWPS
ncbi:MAG: replication restart helicase PriA [Candidatus Rokuibacteriota bacterium]